MTCSAVALRPYSRFDVRSRSGPELSQTDRRPVVRQASTKRVNARFERMHRGRKWRIADFEFDDVLTGCDERPRLGPAP